MTLNNACGPASLYGGREEAWRMEGKMDAPIAWSFELAEGIEHVDGAKKFVDFGPPQLSYTEPHVPEGAVRNLTPLYAAPSPQPPDDIKALVTELDRNSGYCVGQTVQELHDLCRRAADALGRQVTLRAKWLPIAEAKKDGTKYLLAKIVGHPAHPTALWWAVIGHWSSKWNNWNDGIEPSGLADPTHFLPLNMIEMPEAQS